MNTGTRWNTIQSLFLIVLGAAVYSFGLHYFVISNELMEGGVTGIAILLKYAADLPPSITSLVLNIPLFLLGWKTLGKQQMGWTVLGTVSVSFFLWIMEVWIHAGWIKPFRAPDDNLLAALYAGLTLGAGLGLVFRYGGTTGGGDILARLGNKKMGWSMGQVILVFDALVIGASLIYLPQEKVLYTLVSVFIATRTIDFITEGAYAAKEFTIITDKGEEMAQTITAELERGVTLFPARGAYSRTEKNVVYCIVGRSEVHRLKVLVRSLDPMAFMIISDVHDVLGEGFKPE
ncbi:YitT family protein [Gorillibacterium sp. sgz5001074]|uniref:YitT family protein n=1 Tax=Gorillibacterium sp. sgz5001074 TaxID=3446695 RepID=UPI003F66E889